MDKLVKPKNRVTHYNTTFSSITKKKLADVGYKLEDLYKDLFELVDDQTIVIGRCLEYDMRALRIVHHKISDTSMMFRRVSGGRCYRKHLREILATYLGCTMKEAEIGSDLLMHHLFV
uniref:DNA-directed DNA polymerase n=1 Tax=Rhabditophanes sp. KR3021 TaxID=114890 RepID=A0AC35TKA8_9BILA